MRWSTHFPYFWNFFYPSTGAGNHASMRELPHAFFPLGASRSKDAGNKNAPECATHDLGNKRWLSVNLLSRTKRLMNFEVRKELICRTQIRAAGESIADSFKWIPEIGPKVRMSATGASPAAIVLASNARAMLSLESRSPLTPESTMEASNMAVPKNLGQFFAATSVSSAES